MDSQLVEFCLTNLETGHVSGVRLRILEWGFTPQPSWKPEIWSTVGEEKKVWTRMVGTLCNGSQQAMDTSFPTNNKSSDFILKLKRWDHHWCHVFLLIWPSNFPLCDFFGLFFYSSCFLRNETLIKVATPELHMKEKTKPCLETSHFTQSVYFFEKLLCICIRVSWKKRVGGVFPRSFLIGAFWDFFFNPSPTMLFHARALVKGSDVCE